MELCQELLFSVALSLLVSFLLAKLLSMASSDDVTDEKSVSVSVTEKAVMHEAKRGDSESDEKVRSVEEATETIGLEEKGIRAETIGSSVIISKDGEIDNGELSLGEVREERESVGDYEFAERLVDESPERESFREIELESENLVAGSPDKMKIREIQVESQHLFEESPDKTKIREIDVELVKDGVSDGKRVSERKENKESQSGRIDGNEDADDEEEEEDGFFDDWEGIERTELEKRFGAAVVFVASKSNADRIASIGSDVKMELYGLHKVVTEGTCCEPQPMALKVSARMNWNAWQRLGNMSPEVAMEQYVTLLSRSIPGWKAGDTGKGEKDHSDVGASGNLTSKVDMPPVAETERKLEELKPCVGERDVIGVESPNSLKTDNQ